MGGMKLIVFLAAAVLIAFVSFWVGICIPLCVCIKLDTRVKLLISSWRSHQKVFAR